MCAIFANTRSATVWGRRSVLCFLFCLAGLSAFNQDVDLSGLGGPVGFTITGVGSNDNGGTSVNGAGDVNGDGVDDVIVGSAYADPIVSGVKLISAGISCIIFGRNIASGAFSYANVNLTAIANAGSTLGFAIIGGATEDLSGYSVSAAGDVNGDSVADVIVGAIWADPTLAATTAGISYVIFGRKYTLGAASYENIFLSPFTTAGSALGFAILGANAYDSSGRSVSGAGDVNGDGLKDLIVGAFGVAGGAGVTYVIFGRSYTLGVNSYTNINLGTFASAGTSQGFGIFGGAAGDYSGIAVGNAGDVNGDGLSDVIVGAQNANPTVNGVVRTLGGITYVLFGRSSTNGAASYTNIPLSPLVGAGSVSGFAILGAAAGDVSGRSVCRAGDVNKDGIGDMIIGAFKADPVVGGNVRDAAGISYVVFGRSKAVNAPASYANIDLANFASAGSPLGFAILGGATADQSGYSVSAAGDINGDSIDDVIVGAYTADPSTAKTDAGIAYVVFGRSSALGAFAYANVDLAVFATGTSLGLRILGANAADSCGWSVGAAGDANKDGIADVIVSAVNADSGGMTNNGAAYVIFGAIATPSSQPSSQPSRRPSAQPTRQPSGHPSSQPSSQPTRQPWSRPSAQPSSQPSRRPSAQPSTQPSTQPNSRPTGQPSSQPSRQPSSRPSDQPSTQPSMQPSSQPSCNPSSQPTAVPSAQPSRSPSAQPSRQPTSRPSSQPFGRPSTQPSAQPSGAPSSQPSSRPSRQPSVQPTQQPTSAPSAQPSAQPSRQPSSRPSAQPSVQPSVTPTVQPSTSPSAQPTALPSVVPSTQPSAQPTSTPSRQPSTQPSGAPSAMRTNRPSAQPTSQPSAAPSAHPSCQPSVTPTVQPTALPSVIPSTQPSAQPSCAPSAVPTVEPSVQPTSPPSVAPSVRPSSQPSGQPSCVPSCQPSASPSAQPTNQPSDQPSTQPVSRPSFQPSTQPSSVPSAQPSYQPRAAPSGQPTAAPSARPTLAPTGEWATVVSQRSQLTKVSYPDGHVWACEKMASSSSPLCVLADAKTGIITAQYQIPWAGVTSVFATNTVSSVVLSGRRTTSAGTVMTNEAATCTTADQDQLYCTATSFHDTTFLDASYVPYPNTIVFVGWYNVHTCIALLDVASNSVMSYLYTASNMKTLTLSQVQSPPNFVGSFVAGTAIRATAVPVNYIVVGMVRTDGGNLRAMILMPVSGDILNSVDLVNAMALEYTGPDSFIAGGLQLADVGGMNAYLLRVNALYNTISYCVRYRNLSGGRRALSATGAAAVSQSVVRGMVLVDTTLFMIVDQTGNSNITSLTVLKTSAVDGAILKQVHVTALNATSLHCTDIAVSTSNLNIVCTYEKASQAKSLLLSVNQALSFVVLPVGFVRSEEAIFEAETIPFQRTVLTITATTTSIATSTYVFNTDSTVPTRRPSFAPSYAPSSQPSSAPSGQPSSSPTAAPSVSARPTSQPSTSGPTITYRPTVAPSPAPTAKPSATATARPSFRPTVSPSARPTVPPTVLLTVAPTVRPTALPTVAPMARPSARPSAAATRRPSSGGTNSPTVLLADRNSISNRLPPYVVGTAVGGGLGLLLIGYALYQYYQHEEEKKAKAERMKEYFRQQALLTEQQRADLAKFILNQENHHDAIREEQEWGEAERQLRKAEVKAEKRARKEEQRKREINNHGDGDGSHGGGAYATGSLTQAEPRMQLATSVLSGVNADSTNSSEYSVSTLRSSERSSVQHTKKSCLSGGDGNASDHSSGDNNCDIRETVSDADIDSQLSSESEDSEKNEEIELDTRYSTISNPELVHESESSDSSESSESSDSDSSSNTTE